MNEGSGKMTENSSHRYSLATLSTDVNVIEEWQALL